MSALLEPLAGTRSRHDRLAVVLSLFGLLLPLLGLLAPKAVVPLVLVTAGLAAVLLGRRALPWQIMDRPITLAFGLLTLWCLIASLWTFAPGEAAALALRVAVLLLVLIYLCALAASLDHRQRRVAALGFALGMALTVVLVVVEFSFGFPVSSALKGDLDRAAFNYEYHAFSRLNRGISALAILIWPLAALCWDRGWRARALALPSALFALVMASQSSAALLGLGLGILAAAIAALGRRAGRLVLALAVAGALLAGPGFAKLMKAAELDQASYLSETANYRVHIWDFVADRILERPLFGWGFDSSPSIPTEGVTPFRADKNVIPSHPHNGPLQILLELGYVGGTLTIAVLFLLGRKLDGLPAPVRVCGQAMFITILAIASSAYGLWQSHWLTMMGAAAMILVLALPSSPDERKTAPPD
ncbi:O-antigen ligase [Pelagibius sp.]|uniref:O-antigen ligase family protein n=1 Tax=Pelagibius sp. TaxID=1931238 RepID=UPI0026150337|nr:O-antigen ligase family protein [Pelagibius sp.]